MSLLGRLHAALGRDDASLMRRARADVRMGMSLNPPACLVPLSRAIAALERARPSPEVSLLLGRALCAKAQALGVDGARDLRARAVAKLKAQLDQPGLSQADRAALSGALAQAWMPLPGSKDSSEQVFRQLLRAQEAQRDAGTDVAAQLTMAEIELSLCQHPLCVGPRSVAQTALHRVGAARAAGTADDETEMADALELALLHLFPGLTKTSDR